MRWNSDRVHTSVATFSNEAVRNARTNALCDVVFQLGEDFYTLQNIHRGLTVHTVDLQLNGESIARFEQHRYNQHVNLTVHNEHITSEQDMVISALLSELNKLYADLRS